MRPIDREELLWELSASAERAGQIAPIDSLLIRYREDDLSAGERRRVEELLAHDAKARARLAELAAARPREPPSELRAMLLGLAAPPQPNRWRRSALLAIAATTLLALGALLHSTLAPGGKPLPAEVAFELSFKGGLREVRGNNEVPTQAGHAETYETYPSDTIELWLTPEIDIADDLDLTYGVYLQDNNKLIKNTAVEIRPEGGGAKLLIQASELLGGKPGNFEIFVAVGACAPNSIPLRGRAALEALHGGGQRRAYSQPLKLIPEPTAEDPGPDLDS